MIVETTRSHIRLRIGDRTVTVECEAYAPGYGSPNFVVYKDSIAAWDSPERTPVTPKEKDEILEQLKADLTTKDYTFEIE